MLCAVACEGYVYCVVGVFGGPLGYFIGIEDVSTGNVRRIT